MKASALLSKSIQINLGIFVLIVSIIVFGLYGWGDYPTQNSNHVSFRFIESIGYLISMTVLVAFLSRMTSLRGRSVSLTLEIVASSLVVTLLFGILFPYQLHAKLTGDELFHSQSAVAISRDLLNNLLKFSSVKNELLNNSLKRELEICQILILIIFFLTYLFLALKVKKAFFRVAVPSLFLAAVFCNTYYTPYGYKYPSGYLLPQMLSSAVCISPASLRIAQIFTFTLIISYFAKKILKNLNFVGLTLATLGFLTFPVMINGATTIDQAVYFAVLGGVALKLLYDRRFLNHEGTPYFLALLTMARTTALIFVFIYLFNLAKNEKFRTITWKKVWPLLFCTPILIQSARSTLGGFTHKAEPLSQNLAYTHINSPYLALIKSVLTEFDKYSLILLVGSTFLLIASKASRWIVISYIVLVCVVYSLQIPTGVIGLNKYAFEIGTPLIVSAGFEVYEKLFRKFKLPIALTIGALVALMNILFSINFNHTNKPLDSKLDNWGQAPTLISYPILDSQPSRAKITEAYLTGCVNVGATYGYFDLIIAGSEYKNIIKAESQNQIGLDILDWGRGLNPSYELSAKCVVVDDFPAKNALVRHLIELGFHREYIETDRYFGTSTQIWKKSKS